MELDRAPQGFLGFHNTKSSNKATIILLLILHACLADAQGVGIA